MRKGKVKIGRDKEQSEGRGRKNGTEGGGREGDGEKTLARQTIHEFNAS